MNASKKINVNFSSLVGLKAELLRKQAEVNDAKVRSEVIHNVPKVKKKQSKVKEKHAEKKSEKLTDIDDINSHKKSKMMLEAKARLYERLKKSKKGNENFLVDFTNKSDESEDDLPKEEEEEEYEPYIDEDEEGWVEYQDCFGRTRKCLREDLPMMQKKDDLLKYQIMDKQNNEAEPVEVAEEEEIVKEKEPEIEIMRRKWEEQTQKLMDKPNIHYQDVLFDEARAHGVGYYAFSQDEEQRSKQQEMLAKLRKDTEQKQREMKELRELRTKMEQNRLKAARIRQRIRAGLPAEPIEEDLAPKIDTTDDPQVPESTSETPTVESLDTHQKEPDVTTAEQDNEKPENEEETRENKIKALGELLGKRSHWYEMSQEEWVDKCRKARITEFGPVYDNFKKAGYLNSKENEGEHATDPEKEDSTSGATVSGNVNEDDIMAGLKYLRERFEENKST